jgi:hypothetical protein
VYQNVGLSPSAGIAPGTLVEVKGTLRCEEPLTSEMAERTCAYYSSTVTREYLRPDYDDDNDVGSDRRTEIIAQNVQFAPFMVEDDTGFVGGTRGRRRGRRQAGGQPPRPQHE